MLFSTVMHELSIAQEIIHIVTAQQAEHGFEKVNIVRVRAGALSGIEPESLRFSFEVVRQGTVAAEAVLEMDIEPMTLVCRQCGFSIVDSHGPICCEKCGSVDMKVDAGGELDVVSLDVD